MRASTTCCCTASIAPTPSRRSATWPRARACGASPSSARLAPPAGPAPYEPAPYMSDPVIARQASSLPLMERAAFAERLAGNLRTHVFYATRAGFDTVARPEDTQAIPVLREMDAKKFAEGIQPGAPLLANL